MTDELIRRRHFIAIATDSYAADGTFAPLDVGQEIAAMRRWLTDEALGDRRFDDQAYAELAHRPTYERINTCCASIADSPMLTRSWST